ncbi:MAG: histidinol-phosphatase [Cytophagales bacterium]|nr:histidinol-phosphatase [Cytophagales bacterium]
MFWTNYHNHSQYDDGKNTVEEHVTAAIDQHVKSIGFSGHCPVSFENHWCMKTEDLNQYFRDIDHAREKYGDRIQIYKSMEIDYIPGIISPGDLWIKNLHLDYVIGSVHFTGFYENGSPGEVDGTHTGFLHGLEHIYCGDIRQLVADFFRLNRQMVRETRPDIVGHLDKIKMQNRGLWDEDADWYRSEILATLEEIRSASATIEINTRGLYKKLVKEPYPGLWALKQIRDMGIPVHINSDAHTPREITSHFADTAELIYDLGFRALNVLIDGEWNLLKFNKNGLMRP